ncbi:hypothetical protein OAL88_00485 [bacterium]|nr:hypothetical protein [bacterium]
MTRILTIIALLFATPAWAETVMNCDGYFRDHIYRHQSTFFSSEVEKRRDGKWTERCSKEGDDISIVLDIFEDGAVCNQIRTMVEDKRYNKGRG